MKLPGNKSTTSVEWMNEFTLIRVAVAIGLVLFALYPMVLLGSHSFFYQDFGAFTYPAAAYTRDMFWRGEIPLWNPLNNCGVPFLAQWNTSVCYPLSLIYILLPLPWSLNMFCLGHLVLAGCAMYQLAHHWTQNRLAAGVAGISYGLGGLLLNCMLWTSNLAALSWQPMVILMVEQAWQKGGAKRIGIAALVGAMQMLSGAPEVIIFTWVILALLWFGQAVRKQCPVASSLRRIAGVLSLVTAAAAVQILPFLDFLFHSSRNISDAQAEAWSLPVWGLLNFIVPQFHASQSVLQTFQLNEQYWTKSYYVGTGVFALALVGVWRDSRLRTRLLVVIALMGVLLALGDSGYVYGVVKQIFPAISLARYPVKFVSLVVFALPLLAASGLNSLQTAPQDHFRLLQKGVIMIGLNLSLVAGVVLWIAHRFPRPGENWAATSHSAIAGIIFLAAMIFLVLALLRSRSARARIICGATLLLSVALDLAIAGMRLHPVVNARAFGPLEFNMSFRPRFGESRAFVTSRATELLSRLRTADPVDYCVGVRGALFQNHNLREDLPKVDGFTSLRLREYDDVAPLLDRGNDRLAAPLADFLGVAQVVFPWRLSAWQARSNFMPLVTAGQKVLFEDTPTVLEALAGDGFQPRREVYLPVIAKATVRATPVTEAEISSFKSEAHRISFAIEAEATTIAVIAHSFYHNWQALVDGRPVQLWRANHAFQALEVPEGHHEVVLVYRDRLFVGGGILSCLAFILILLLCLTRIPRSYIRKDQVALRAI